MPKQSINDNTKARLLACIPEGLIATAAARRRLTRLTQRSTIPKNAIRPEIETFTSPYTAEDYLSEQGVDISLPQHRRIRELTNALQPAISAYRGRPVTNEQATVLLQKLHDLLEAISQPNVHMEQARFGFDTVAQAADVLADSDGLHEKDTYELGKILEAVLKLSKPDEAQHFDEHGTWGGPAPLVPAADAVMTLALKYPPAFEHLIEIASRLDFAPARAHVAARIAAMKPSYEALMWKLGDYYGLEEASIGVLRLFTAHSLGWLLNYDTARARRYLERIFVKASTPNRVAKDLRESCLALYTDRYIRYREPSPAIDALLAQPTIEKEDLKHVLFTIRAYLKFSTGDETINKRARDNAFSLFERITDYALDRRTKFLANPEGFSEDAAGAIYQVLSFAAEQLYFASGAFHESGLTESDARTPDDVDFFNRVVPIVQRFVVTEAASIPHHLIQLLEFFIPIEPLTVFLLIVEMVRAVKDGAFQFEPMAADLMVRVISEYMSSYRDVIEYSDVTRKGLIDCLDAFSAWPSAVKLVYRFDDLFR